MNLFESEIHGSTSKYTYTPDLNELLEYFFVRVVINVQRIGTDRLVFGIPFYSFPDQKELERVPYYSSSNFERYAFCIGALYSKSGLDSFLNFSPIYGFKFDLNSGWTTNSETFFPFISSFFSYEIEITYAEFRELIWLVLIEFKSCGGDWNLFFSSDTVEYIKYRLCGMANLNDFRGLVALLSDWLEWVNPSSNYGRWCYDTIRDWNYYFVDFSIFRSVSIIDSVHVAVFNNYCWFSEADPFFDSLAKVNIPNRMFAIESLKYGIGVNISTESINVGIKGSRKNLYLSTFNSKIYAPPLMRSFEGVKMFKEFGHHIVLDSVFARSEMDRWSHISNYLAFSDSLFGGIRDYFDHSAAYGRWYWYKYRTSDFLTLVQSMEIYCHYDNWIVEIGGYSNFWMVQDKEERRTPAMFKNFD